jgi:hypothetical protein
MDFAFIIRQKKKTKKGRRETYLLVSTVHEV